MHLCFSNHLWALLRKEDHLISLAVDGKSGEPFDNTVGEWLKGGTPNSGKPSRLIFLCEGLGFPHGEVNHLRYQLLHRVAMALLEAERSRLTLLYFLSGWTVL